MALGLTNVEPTEPTIEDYRNEIEWQDGYIRQLRDALIEERATVLMLLDASGCDLPELRRDCDAVSWEFIWCRTAQHELREADIIDPK